MVRGVNVGTNEECGKVVISLDSGDSCNGFFVTSDCIILGSLEMDVFVWFVWSSMKLWCVISMNDLVGNGW